MSPSTVQEKRISQRHKPDQAIVEIPLTYPKGTKLTCEVFDMHHEGLAFRMSLNDGFLAPGTTIEGIKIYNSIGNGSKPKRLTGVIKYARPYHNDGELCYRVGLEFVLSKQLVPQKGTPPFPLRPRRYSAHGFFRGEAEVSFQSEGERFYQGTVLDFSKYGAAIEIKETLVLKTSDILKNFNIFVRDENIFSGEAIVVRLENVDNICRLGVSFRESVLDVVKAVSLKRTYHFKDQCLNIISKARSAEQNISNDFKVYVCDLCFFFESMKTLLNEEDQRICSGGYDIVSERKAVLKSISEQAYSLIKKKLMQLQEIARGLSESDQEIYKVYFRKQLNSTFLLSPVLARSYRKPLGFAGDYQIMNFLYGDALTGQDLFTMFLDVYTYSESASRAVFNRVSFLIKEIAIFLQAHQGSEKSKVKLASVGCGPAKEIQELIKKDNLLDTCLVTLTDFDSEALLYAQERVMLLKTKYKRNFKLKVIQDSVSDILRKGFSEKQDFLYSMGLFDYLDDSIARHLLARMYESAQEGGVIIVGNMDPASQSKFYMEYVMDWYLIYRTRSELLNLTRSLFPVPLVEVTAEETGTNNFMVIRKPKAV